MKLSARRREVGDALAPTSRFSWLGINRRQIDRAVDSCVRSQLTPEEDILRHELEQARKVNARLAQDAADLSDKLNWMRYLAHRAAEGMPLTAAHEAVSCLAELIAETDETDPISATEETVAAVAADRHAANVRLLAGQAWARYCIAQATRKLVPHTADPGSYQPHIARDVEALQDAVAWLGKAYRDDEPEDVPSIVATVVAVRAVVESALTSGADRDIVTAGVLVTELCGLLGVSTRQVSPSVEGPARYDQCDGTCTVDCGHCKGAGRPGSVAA